MKVKIISDMHFEFWDGREQELINLLPLSKEDILIAAGDIVSFGFNKGMKHLDIFKSLCERVKLLIYVPGNHEYYHCHMNDVDAHLAYIEKEISNMKILSSGNVFEYEGRRFIGDVLWFRETPGVYIYKKFISDPHVIKDIFPRVFNEQMLLEAFLNKELKEGDIVVTHHLPSPRSQPKEYMDSSTTPYFVCDMEKLIYERKPAVWIHGHTHNQCYYNIGSTKIISRPIGYPSENPGWREWQFEFDI